MIGKIILVNMNFFGRMFDISRKFLFYHFQTTQNYQAIIA